MAEIKAREGSSWIKVDVDYVKNTLRKIWEISQERDFGLALILAESYGDVQLREDITFLKKLIQLEASGYIQPPLRFVDMYVEVREG